MDNIKAIINRVIGDLSEQRQPKEKEVFAIWQSLMSEKERKHQKLVGIKDNKLSVQVDSSVWMYELKLKEHTYLKEIKKTIPEIEKIIFKIGSVL